MQGASHTFCDTQQAISSASALLPMFGKNHLGDRDEHLPTMHGFDEFFGNLYHLNAEEEPELRDYPPEKDYPNFKKNFGTSNTYYDWLIDHVYLLVPAQSIVGNFLATFKEFPPRQKAASFSVDQVVEKLTEGIGSR